MPKIHRLTGLFAGSVDTKTREIRFELAVSDARPIAFIAKYGVAAQPMAGLGRMMIQLQKVLLDEKARRP